MADQYGVNRVYTTVDEKDSSLKATCPKCFVEAVPRGISDTHATATGEKHCPNCGHVYGRDDH